MSSVGSDSSEAVLSVLQLWGLIKNALIWQIIRLESHNIATTRNPMAALTLASAICHWTEGHLANRLAL